MRTIAIGVVATAAIGFGTAAGQQRLTAQAPDLAPVPARILNGVASVRNAGSAAAGPFVLTVQCQKQGGGGCAESPGMAAYENPAYPNRLVIPVAGLAAGKVFNHTLPFWKGLKWQPGDYNFVLEADAGKTVAETNEGNNFGGAVLSKP
jgi:hypothetical protein